jgi:hypothetical protein
LFVTTNFSAAQFAVAVKMEFGANPVKTSMKLTNILNLAARNRRSSRKENFNAI